MDLPLQLEARHLKQLGSVRAWGLRFYQDFGYFIPGHGGVTDRFDCQVVMGLFTFLYQKTFVPQIGQAEAAARRTAQQQRIQILLQHQQHPQPQTQGPEGSGEFKGGGTSAGCVSPASQEHLAPPGEGDTAVAALLHAAQSLNSQQLLALQRRLEAMAAAKAAAGN